MQNEGLGAARNTGIPLATGAYILFIYCDDWIDETYISDLYNLLKKTDSDIAICNFTQFIQDEDRYNIHISTEDYYEAVYTPQEWFQFQYGVGHNLSACFTVP